MSRGRPSLIVWNDPVSIVDGRCSKDISWQVRIVAALDGWFYWTMVNHHGFAFRAPTTYGRGRSKTMDDAKIQARNALSKALKSSSKAVVHA
jgi:hypothetical protein